MCRIDIVGATENVFPFNFNLSSERLKSDVNFRRTIVHIHIYYSLEVRRGKVLVGGIPCSCNTSLLLIYDNIAS